MKSGSKKWKNQKRIENNNKETLKNRKNANKTLSDTENLKAAGDITSTYHDSDTYSKNEINENEKVNKSASISQDYEKTNAKKDKRAIVKRL